MQAVSPGHFTCAATRAGWHSSVHGVKYSTATGYLCPPPQQHNGAPTTSKIQPSRLQTVLTFVCTAGRTRGRRREQTPHQRGKWFIRRHATQASSKRTRDSTQRGWNELRLHPKSMTEMTRAVVKPSTLSLDLFLKLHQHPLEGWRQRSARNQAGTGSDSQRQTRAGCRGRGVRCAKSSPLPRSPQCSTSDPAEAPIATAMESGAIPLEESRLQSLRNILQAVYGKWP